MPSASRSPLASRNPPNAFGFFVTICCALALTFSYSTEAAAKIYSKPSPPTPGERLFRLTRKDAARTLDLYQASHEFETDPGRGEKVSVAGLSGWFEDQRQKFVFQNDADESRYPYLMDGAEVLKRGYGREDLHQAIRQYSSVDKCIRRKNLLDIGFVPNEMDWPRLRWGDEVQVCVFRYLTALHNIEEDKRWLEKQGFSVSCRTKSERERELISCDAGMQPIYFYHMLHWSKLNALIVYYVGFIINMSSDGTLYDLQFAQDVE